MHQTINPLRMLIRGALLLGLLLPRSAAASPLGDAQQLLQSGQYAQAEKAFAALLKSASRGRAALGLARVQLETGRYAEAARTARGAAAGKEKADSLTLVGEAQRLLGDLPQAETTLKQVTAASPKHYRALAYLGLVYHEQGKAAEAKTVFDVFYDDYAAGKIKKTSATDLTYVAMACRYTDNFRDASDTLREAVQVDPKQVEAHLQWAEISLEKYEAGYAEQHFQDVLKVNPSHAGALIGLAQVKLEQANDVEGAKKLLDQAEKISPQHLDAAALRAFVLLDAEENQRAETLLNAALRLNPNHLGALAMLGASAFLRDDAAEFTRLRDRVLKLNPRYTRFFREVVELAVRHHRYAESIDLSQQAIKIDQQDWYSLADLGTNHLRLGDDPQGLKYLREAWKGDPFNVRTYNLLNLYEDVVAKEYVFIQSKHFRLRVHKTEEEVLRRTVIPLLEKAYGIYAAKYRFTPQGPIVIELFRDPNQYAVRTVGLPGLAALGVCFGRVITSTSPTNARFNWGQVLWHELNHVFTIQLTRSRVPRWLTEGLADLEPTLERPEWKRENDFDIYRALRAGRLRGLASMNMAFTQAKSLQDMVVAYYQGSLMAAYLVKSWGMGKMLEALRAYGRRQRTEQILPVLTQLPLGELDRRFRAAEEKRLAFYGRNFYLDLELYDNLEARQKAAAARPADAGAQTDLAAALLAAGKREEAGAQAAKALAVDGTSRVALYVAAQAALGKRDGGRAATLLGKLLSAGGDGYEPRMALAELAFQKNDLREATKHLEAAKRLDPEKPAPYALLAKAHEKTGQTDRLIAELKALAELDQQTLAPVAKLVDLLAGRKDWAGVRQYGTMAYYIQPASAKLHGLLAEAYAAPAPAADGDRAIWHLETALLCRPERPADLRVALARQLLKRRDTRRAREQLTEALKADPHHAGAKALRSSLGGP